MNKDTGRIVIRFPESPHNPLDYTTGQRSIPLGVAAEMVWVDEGEDYFRIGHINYMEAVTYRSRIQFKMRVDVTNLNIVRGEGVIQTIYDLFKKDALCEHVRILRDTPAKNMLTLEVEMCYWRMIHETCLDPVKVGNPCTGK